MEVTAYNETFALPAAGRRTPPPERLLAVLDEMMETAGRHAEKLGVGVRDLHAKGLTWVLARLHVEIASIPAAGHDRAHRHLAVGPPPPVRRARVPADATKRAARSCAPPAPGR